MKVKKLGLPVRKGLVHTVHEAGRILATENEETRVVKKVALPKDARFLFYIDEDGDLAKEFQAPPRKADKWPKASATEPASAKLDARALYAKIDELLFPPEEVMLAHAGMIFDAKKSAQARKVYEKELARLAKEISVALGPPTTYEVDGETRHAWKLKDRAVELSNTMEDTEFPGRIELSRIDPATVDWNL